MEQWGKKLDLGWGRGEVILEDDLAFVETALPGGSFLPGDSEPVKSPTISQFGREKGKVYLLPQHEIHGPVLVLHGPSNEPKRVILPPGLSLFRQTGLGNSGHL